MIANTIIYLAIGERGSIGDLTVEAIEDPYDSCLNCSLRKFEGCLALFGPCESEYRPDGRCVIFKEVKNDEKH